MANIIEGTRELPLDCNSNTLLDAIRGTGIEFDAPCGGNGTCGKCAVWVRDSSGLRRELACSCAPTDDMTVYVETDSPISIAETGVVQTPYPHDESNGFGLAIDIGTTTMVVRLFDCENGSCLGSLSRTNPQVSFGADVIARISACANGSLDALSASVRNAMADMARTLCAQAGIKSQQIEHAAVAGNTVMESIAAGVSPEPIGVNPFVPLDYFGHDVDLPKLAREVYFAPCLSGYVGGDITAGILACDMMGARAPMLLIDLGTNGEMALGNASGIITCATAAGPVFEGANIAFGMPARAGAICAVKRIGDDIGIELVGDADGAGDAGNAGDTGGTGNAGNAGDTGGTPENQTRAFGICGTGIIDAVAVLLDAGIVDETGYLCDADELPELPAPLAARITESPDGKGNAFLLAPNIYLTQADIRNVQLAKAAVCAGILTMLEKRTLSAKEIESVLIAGGFGQFLNIDSAVRIGLIPSALRDRTRSVGNTSIEGVSALLLSNRARNDTRKLEDIHTYIELSTSSAFNMFYVECMSFE